MFVVIMRRNTASLLRYALGGIDTCPSLVIGYWLLVIGYLAFILI